MAGINQHFLSYIWELNWNHTYSLPRVCNPVLVLIIFLIVLRTWFSLLRIIWLHRHNSVVLNKTDHKTIGNKRICKNLLFIYCLKYVLVATRINEKRVQTIATSAALPHWAVILKYLLTNTNAMNKFQIIYRIICKFLQDFQPLRYSSQDGHAEGEHVTLQLLDMSTLGDVADVSPVIKFLPHTFVAETWLQDWHLPRPQMWIYRAPVR